MSLDKRLFIWLFIAFIIATVIGTLTHECGHFIVAKCLGYDAWLHYGSTGWKASSPNQVVNPSDGFWILIGGPFETMLTGTVGLALLFSFRKSFDNAIKLSFGQWFLIFVSLFWLRPTANLVAGLGRYLINGNFFNHSDEIKVAKYLKLPDLSISILTAIIGAIVLTIVIFKFVPANKRLTFIYSGIAGGITGYVLWLVLFGKYLIP
jgi:hypothetical protein